MNIIQKSSTITHNVVGLIASIIIFVWGAVKANTYLLTQDYFAIAILGIFMIIIAAITISFLHDLAKQLKKGGQ